MTTWQSFVPFHASTLLDFILYCITAVALRLLYSYQTEHTSVNSSADHLGLRILTRPQDTAMDDDTSTLQSLQSQDQAELLDDIDRLRAQGIDHYIPLPQLIVCGDQSSGKSSVLEAISRVAFPTNDILCTRFATEVILRRSPEKSASVKIIPGKDAAPERREKLKDFQKMQVTLREIPQLIDDAKVVMGLSADSTFCDDKLQVEISGPEQPHLTMVDLPGLIHATNKPQMGTDVEAIKELVGSYMRGSRSIILAVVSAKNDHANQIVLQMARTHDREGSRTMGIITKADTLHTGSASELSFLTLAKNEHISFRHGWHLLRNPDYHERNSAAFDRDQVEKTFFTETPPWNTLPTSCFAIDALRNRLSKILLEHISTELPKVIRDIQLGIEQCNGTLARLGPPRESSRDQRLYLTNISQRFQRLARDAVDGYYSDPFFGTPEHGSQKRLRAVVVNLSHDFAADMSTRGHSREITDETSRRSPFSVLNHPLNGPAPISRTDFIGEIQKLLKESRGRELAGTFNPLLIGSLFGQHSKAWESIADTHLLKVLKVVKVFLEDLVGHVAGDTTCDALLQEVIDPAIELKRKTLKSKVDELMTPYRKGFPATYNRQFVARLEKLRSERQFNEMQQVSEGEYMDRHAGSDLLDCMLAYYRVALDIFVDNVAALAVENCLIGGLEDLISPYKVAEMGDEELQKLAAESEEDQSERTQATNKLRVLESGLQTCKRHARRKPATLEENAGGLQTLGGLHLSDRMPGSQSIGKGVPLPSMPRTTNPMFGPTSTSTFFTDNNQSKDGSARQVHRSPGALFSSSSPSGAGSGNGPPSLNAEPSIFGGGLGGFGNPKGTPNPSAPTFGGPTFGGLPQGFGSLGDGAIRSSTSTTGLFGSSNAQPNQDAQQNSPNPQSILAGFGAKPTNTSGFGSGSQGGSGSPFRPSKPGKEG